MLNNFFKFFTVVFLLAMFMFPQNSFAQLTGTKTIPGDYATITAAVTDLNAQGVGSGGVIFNVAAGHTESSSADITITATGTAGNAIVFQKSGAGVNPLITRTDAGAISTSTLGGLGDAIIRFDGTDYITFDGIDVTASDQGIEYGYLTHKPDGTNGCQFVTIKNAVVTMTKGTSGYVVGIYIGNGASTASSATGVTVTATSGINSDITITGNTIQNVHAGIVSRGSSAAGFSDNNVIIGQSGAGNIIQNFGGGNVSTTYAVYFIYVSNPSVAYNTINNEGGGGVAHGSTLYGIFFSSGITGIVVASNNAFTLANIAASSATQYIYSLNAVTSYTFNNNTFAAGTISSTGTVYLIYASSSTPDVTVSGNVTVGTITHGGGSTYCYYNFGSPASGTETITNNNFSNITVSTGSSGLYGIYTNTAVGQNRVTSNNTVSNLNHLGTGAVYGLYALSTTSNQVNDNNVFDITTGGTVYGLYFSGTNPTVYNNNVYNLTTSGTSMYGLYNSGTGTTNCYKNQVYNLTNNNASATLYGFYITTGTSNYVYNNFVSDLKAPNSASLTGLVGMYVSGGTSIGLYYNTIFLNATSVGANFSASGIYASSTPTVDMRNNIVVNSSTPNGTGLAIAYRRSSTTLTSYSALSNNNSFYSGVPSATNLIYYDGTNSDQTIGDYKTRVTPRDASSFSENVPFINSTTAPYNLHMNTGIATQTESGGTPVSTPIAVADDFDGNTRNLTTPDVGADEFAGVGLDLSAPSISYTPLLNTGSTSARSLVVTVTDASGVPTTGPGWPNLYWSVNAGAYTAATPTSVVGSAYTFSFGAGVTVGDVVSYYVVAQDLAGTPNIGAFPSAGASGFTANPPAAATPPTTPSSYTVTAASLSGTYTVGLALFNSLTGRNITFEKSVSKVMREVIVPDNSTEKTKNNSISDALSLTGEKKMIEVEEVNLIPMENGLPYAGDLFIKKADNPQFNFGDGIEGIYATITAAVADLNLRGVSGATTFSLVDAVYSSASETYPIVVDVTNVNVPTATNTVTFKPALGVSPTISGNAAALFKLYGADYITFDGSNTVGGTTRNMTLLDSTTALSGVIWIGSKSASDGASFNTVKNCNITGFSGTTTTAGVILGSGATLGGAAEAPNNNNTVTNNNITAVQNGVYHSGFAATQDQNISITNNILGSAVVAEKLGYRGLILINAGNITVTGNTISGVVTSSTSTAHGIQLSSVINGGTIAKNKISNITNTNSGGYSAIGITLGSSSTAANVLVANNFIWDVAGYGYSSTTTDNGFGINLLSGGGYNLYHNSVDLSTNQTSATGNPAALIISSTVTTAASLDIRDNIFSITSTVGTDRLAVRCNTANTVFANINYNDYYTTGPNLGYIGSLRVDLAAWQTGTGQDVNSISGDPGFVSANDLHITTTNNFVSNKGFYLASVPTDIDGDTRSLTTPDIGADEYTYAPPSVLDPTAVTATAISQTQIDVAFTRNANLNNVLVVWNATGTFTAPVGAPPAVGQPFAGGMVMYYGPTSPASHTGLTASTLYYYKAYSYNGSLYSPGVDVNATTLNAPITVFPYTQNFTGTFPPTGFTNYGTKMWTQSPAGGVGGTAAARVSYSPAGTANLQMPNVILPATPNYRVKFWWKDNDIFSRPGDDPEIAGYDTTYFEISTNGGTSWTVLSFLSAASSQSAYVESVNDLTSYAGQTVALRWRDVSDGSFNAYGTGLDDITIEEIPAGPVYSVSPTSKNFGPIISGNSSVPQNFTISNVGAADLIINTGGITLTGTNANQFVLGSITYPITVIPGGNAVITVTFSPTSAGSKSANLNIVHNAPGSPSVVALSGQGLAAGVLFEDFTNADALARWKVVNLDGGTSEWYRSTSKFNSSPASAGCDYESDGRQNNDWLISPKLIVAAGDSLTFWHSIQSASFPETMVIKVGTTTNDPTTGTWVDLATIVDNTTTWKYKKYDLSAYAGQQIYVAFVDRSTDMWTLFVDDILGPVVYVPAVDLAFTQFYQSSGLPVPRSGENFNDYRISMNSEISVDEKPNTLLLSNVGGVQSSDINNTTLVDGGNIGLPIELANVSIKAFVKNFGLNAASYNLAWNVNGISQTPYSGPSVGVGATDSTVLTYTPTAQGTFITTGNITVTADENPDNNVKNFRMRVYPDVFTRTLYDRGDNLVDTWVGWGPTGTTPFKAGVRYTATATVKLAGLDFIYDTGTLTPGEIIVQVRAAGTTTTAPGAVLYTAIYNSAAYFPGGGDYIHLPFGNDAPTIASGSDYWITVKVPLGANYPGAVHNTGFIPGRSFFESNTDTTLWNALVITTERAWIMRSVEVTPGPATFPLTVTVANGWNMVSTPGLHPVNQNVTTWWSGKDPAAGVFRYSSGYQSVTTTTPGQGYWMKHVGANTYNTGDEWPAGGIQIVPNVPITGATGWNLIGGFELSVLTANITTTPGGLRTGQVFGYSGGYSPATNLVPGYAYWIKLTGPGSINIPTSLAKGLAKTTEVNTTEWGKIIITDAAGKSYTLYSVKGEVNLNDYELPPAPPAGMFDVRFGSGRYAEALGTSNQAIELNSLEYPVTVRVENADIRLQDQSGNGLNERLKAGEEVIISNNTINKLMVSGEVIPDKYALEQNYPNPFNPSTKIEFSIPEDVNNVRLTIYNALGQRVAELVNSKMEAGKYSYIWNASNLATGLYIYELRTDKFVSVKKMMLLK